MQSHPFAQVWDDTLQQLSWTVANHAVTPKVRTGGGLLVAEILDHLKYQRSPTILWDKTSYQVVQDFWHQYESENMESWEKHQTIWSAGGPELWMLLSHPSVTRAPFSTCSSQSLLPRVATISGWKAKRFPWVALCEIDQLRFFETMRISESHLFLKYRLRCLQDDYLSLAWKMKLILCIYAEPLVPPCLQKCHTLPGLLKHQSLRSKSAFPSWIMQITDLGCWSNSVYTYYVFIYTVYIR